MTVTFCGVAVGWVRRYVCMQLLSDNSHDLVVLRKIIAQMSGVEAIEDLTETQLAGQTGGPILRGETNTGRCDAPSPQNLQNPCKLLRAQILRRRT
eukprot:COSAG05_NODE_177_length_14916_cov_8.104002_10_plen_96_part_00